MQDSVIKRVILLGALAISAIIILQAYWGINNYKLNEAEFQQTVHIALLRVAKSISKSNKTALPNTTNLIKKMSTNYYVVNTNSNINAGELEFYLQREFHDLALNTDFEYAIHDCETNEMVYGNLCKYEDKQIEGAVLGKLPKYDEFIYYFGVKFPSRKGYLLSQMQSTFILAGVLLITTLFFIYSLYVILSQKRLSDMQKDFINNMTHEFKTPISTIKISSDVFLNDPNIKENARLLKYAGIIKDQNQRLNNQVEKVLQIAKLEKENFQLKKEAINLHDLLMNVVKSVELNVANSSGTINTQLNATAPMLNADRLHLSNIIYNMIDNAIKYCNSEPKIQINTKSANDKIELSIIDNGIGIEKEHHTKVFNKFYRVPTGNVHDVKGFGLGLFYIKNICEAHGWKINLESELGRGTSINVTMS